MKRAYIQILIFFWGFHFALPLLYFLFWGYVNLYSNYISYEGAIYNTFVILISTILIWKYCKTENSIPTKRFRYAKSFFLISVGVYIIKYILGGGYEGAMEGTTHGSLISFLSLFFSPEISFLFLLLNSNVKHPVFWILLYVGLFTVTGSRSAVLGVLFLFLYSPAFGISTTSLLKKIKMVFIALAIVSPFLFIYATNQRGKGDIDSSVVRDVIVGRISFVELSSIPFESRKAGELDKVLFSQKYSTENQLKQSFNSISPIDPFESDVAPNQYFRAVFLGANEVSVLDRYLSLNLTFPSYSVIKTNRLVGITISILFLVSLFIFWRKYRRNQFVFMVILFSLYDLLYFFDWVMICQRAFTICLTLFAIRTYEMSLNGLLIKKKRDVKKVHV